MRLAAVILGLFALPEMGAALTAAPGPHVMQSAPGSASRLSETSVPKALAVVSIQNRRTAADLDDGALIGLAVFNRAGRQIGQIRAIQIGAEESSARRGDDRRLAVIALHRPADARAPEARLPLEHLKIERNGRLIVNFGADEAVEK